MKKIKYLLFTIIGALAITSCTDISASDSSSDDTSTASYESSTSTQVYYTNPVFNTNFPDPTCIRGDDGYYYAFSTQSYGSWGNDIYGTKYVPIMKSLNLIEWEFVGQVFSAGTRPTWGTANAGIWAPDIVKIDDTYNLYYSLSIWGDEDPGIGVCTATELAGPWTDCGKVFKTSEIGVNNSIDPNVVVDTDGRVYMVWGSMRGNYIIELTSDGLSLLNPETAADDKIRVAGYDTGVSWAASTYEGSFILPKDGYYYLFLSSGSCCEGYSSSYHVEVGRATTITGPYYDDDGNDMLAGNRGHHVINRSSYFIGTGHNTIVDDAGEYWMLYHAYYNDSLRGSSESRVLCLDMLYWDEEGWPNTIGTMPSNSSTLGPTITLKN